MEKESLEPLLGQGLSLEQIGRRFGKHPSTVSYWLEKHGLEAVNRAKHAPRGGLDRAVLKRLVDEGMTIAEIANEVDRSTGTVRLWLARYGMAVGRYVVHPSRGNGIRPRGTGLLPLQALSSGTRFRAPTQKRLTLSRNGVTLSLDAVRAEAAKCALLCSNCHAEVEAGVTAVPATVRDGPLPASQAEPQ